MNPQENKMGVMPVKKLVLVMSWPIMLSMLVQALYNFVDGIFVSKASSDAFLALGFAFPAQSLMIAICAGTGVGVNAILARRLGEGRSKEAADVATHSYFIYLCCWVLFALFGIFLSGPFIGLFTSDPLIRQYGTDYLRIVTIGSIGMCMQFSAERILQASGNSIGPMIIQGTGALFNIIFDPILIFGYFGFPKMGVAGAAVATIGGQLLGMILGFIMVKRNRVVVFHFRDFRLQGPIISSIYRIGLPSIAMQSLTTVMVFGMNKFLGMISDAHVFVLTAYFKIQSFVFMPVFGLNNGLIPIVSFNYGAREPGRIREAVRFSLKLSLVIMCIGMLLFWAIPDPLLSLFEATENAEGTAAALDFADVLKVGVPALRMISLSFPLAAIAIILIGVFQALGAPLLSLICALTRTLIVLLPAAALFTFLYPVGVWAAFPIAEGLSLILTIIFYKTVAKSRIMALQ